MNEIGAGSLSGWAERHGLQLDTYTRELWKGVEVAEFVGRVRWDRIISGLPQKAKGCLNGYQKWIKSGLEEDWLECFPARTKSDLSIRRTRARDLWNYVCITKTDIGSVLKCLRGKWDYISALNLCWASILIGTDIYSKFAACGAMNDGLEHFIDTAKEVSNRIKTLPYVERDRFKCLEWQSLSGYRNPPFPGFDKFTEAEDLAKGGTDRFWPPGITLDDCIVEALPLPPLAIRHTSLTEYIRSKTWVTSGSSSVGRLRMQFNGEDLNIKAKKNTVLDCIWMDDLISYVCNDEQPQMSNWTIVKAELGKLRIAVASDLKTYLLMSWIGSVWGPVYDEWPTNTMNEDFKAQTARTVRMLSLLRTHNGLPYDYKGFDHQPQTSELQAILSHIAIGVRPRVNYTDVEEYDRVMTYILASFDNQVLSTVEGEKTLKLEVSGGLMSGLFWTSLLGNAWNAVMTTVVQKLLTGLGFDTSTIVKFVRGDDSAIFAIEQKTLAFFAEGYNAIGIEGGVGKYSVRPHEMEFLRIWYDNLGCHGYPARALPGITQRKPWSPNPWKDVGTMEAVFSVLSTLRRRECVNTDYVWAAVSKTWSQKTQIPSALLRIPRTLGGFGVQPWDGETYLTSGRVPNIPPLDGLVFPNYTNERASDWKRKAADLALPLTDYDAYILGFNEFRSTLTADDIPSLSKLVREEWRREIKKVRFKLTRRRLKPITEVKDIVVHLENLPASDKAIDAVYEYTDNISTSYGSWKKLKNVMVDLKKILPRVKIRLMDYLRQNYPAFHDDIVYMRRGRGSMATAIDWLLGELPTSLSWCNPQLSKLVAAAAGVTVKEKTIADRHDGLVDWLWYVNTYDILLYNSQFSRWLYQL